MDKEMRLKKYLEEHPKEAELFYSRGEYFKEMEKKRVERKQKNETRRNLFIELRKKGFTLQKIADTTTITRERVRQIILGR